MRWFKNYFTASFTFAVAAIVQAISHVSLSVYGYYLNVCGILPRRATELFIYLTYLYNSHGGTLELMPDTLLPLPPSFLSFVIDEANLDNIVQEMLNKSILPERANAEPRMLQYIICFIVIDTVWLVSSIALLMGVCFNIKQIGTLLFYGPWLVTTVLTLLLDVVATVHFSLDLFRTTTITDWMKFVGIENVDDLQDLDSENTFNMLSMLPTLTVLSFTTKCIFFWIVNVIGIYYVTHATILAYQQSYDDEQQQKHHHNRRKTRNNVDLDTTAERIRNWQLFYGATETAESNANDEPSSSSSSASSPSNKNIEWSQPQICSATTNNDYMDELKNQKPWSYVQCYNNLAKLKIQQNSELVQRF